ncbi:hypothetical protein N0V84_000564 [Fusarium piperis]|uniref:Uncharacterized protein n=1 Tax=Fusarium piperis TaxID=1435070 RepID=A0A9W8WMR0_9HYPO|nr:hypothetical protein N0V84_000564 [Fusarium piperis]
MPDRGPPLVLRLFQELKGLIDQYDEAFERILSPEAAFERKSGEIRARIDELWAKLPTAQPEDTTECKEKIVELSGTLKEIEICHKKRMVNENNAYHDRLLLTYNALRAGVRKILAVKIPEEPSTPTAYKDGNSLIRKPSKKLSLSVNPSLSSPQQRAKPSSSRQAESQGTPTTPSVTQPAGKRKDSSLSLLTPEQKRRKLDSTDKTPHSRPRGSHKRHENNNILNQQDCECITDPEPGQVYLAFWQSSKQWVPVLLLPMTDLPQVGVSGSIDSLGLADEMLPICYDQDSLTGERKWRDGYEDGQPLVTEREFPVIYFEGRKFPEESPGGWVAAKDLRKFDVAAATSHLVPQIEMVRGFLKERAANREGEGSSHGEDISPCVEDQPQRETSTLQDSLGPGTAMAPEASNDRQLASEATAESQPAPERSTPLRPVLVMADLTSLTRDPTPFSESEYELRPQVSPARNPGPSATTEAQPAPQESNVQSDPDTVAAMDLEPAMQTLVGNTGLAPEATMAIEGQAPADESPEPTFKIEPHLNIPLNMGIPRDIEIISIESTESEEEDDDEAVSPEFTNATLELDGPLGPVEQSSVEEDGEARPQHHDQNQSEGQSDIFPDKPSLNLFEASEQAQTPQPQSYLSTGSTLQTSSGRATDQDHAQKYGTRPESDDSMPPHTSTEREAPSTESNPSGDSIQAILIKHGLFDLARLWNSGSDPPTNSQIHTSPQDTTVQSPRAESQSVTQTPSASLGRGSTQIPPDTRVNPLPQPSLALIHYTPLNSSTQSSATGSAPSAAAAALPPPITRPSAPSSDTRHRGATSLSDPDQHLSNYGITRAPARQPGHGLMRGTQWHHSFPRGLVRYLEDHLRTNKAPVIGMEALMNSSGRYFCLLCKPSKRKAYVRAGNFLSHITRHWETVEGHLAP